MMRPLEKAVAVLLVIGALAGCGVDSGSEGAGRATTAPATTRPSDPGSEPTTTSIPAASSAPSSTAAPSTSTTVLAANGSRFTDPDGRFVIDSGPEWEKSPSSLANGIEMWFVGRVHGGFRANVNILTQTTPKMTLERYLEISRRQINGGLPSMSALSLVASGITTTASGRQVLTIEYRGTMGSQALHFLATAVPVADGFAIATFTAPDRLFPTLRDRVEPYLLTLRPT